MTKIISLADDAYDSLKLLKNPGESFSEVVRRISKKEKSILDFFGKWPGTRDELNKISKELTKERNKFKTREVGF
ncbi:antitoxin VapB family protein [Candidatus Woesearchaeota archaeon]|nr:antitoxin VapB family protein [Candidatus Woesearchaeota archaeon]